MIEALEWYQALFKADIWRATQWPVLSLLLITLIWDLKKKFGLPLVLLFAAQILACTYQIYFDYPNEGGFNFHIRLVMAQTLLGTTAAALIVLHAQPRFFELLKQGLILFAIVNSFTMLSNHFQGRVAGGLIPSHAVASSFLACLFPWFLELKQSPYLKIPICLLQALAIFFAGGTTGILCLFVVTLTYFQKINWKWAILSALLLLPGLYFMPKADLSAFWNPTGRLQIWAEALRQWGEGSLYEKFMGFGLGSWEWLFPVRYSRTGSMKDIWLFAHNDFVQVFFENGILGILGLISLGLKLGLRDKSRSLNAIGVGYGLAMLTQSPSRIACFQLLGVYILAEWCRNDSDYLESKAVTK